MLIHDIRISIWTGTALTYLTKLVRTRIANPSNHGAFSNDTNFLTDQSFQFRFVIRTNEFHVDNNFDDRAAKFISATPLLLTLSILRNKCSLHIFGIGYSKGTHFLSARESFGLTTVPTFWPIRRSA